MAVGFFTSAQPASADSAQIDASSCGGWTGTPNAYCSFETTGEDIVIDANSCTLTGSCLNLANGVTIGIGSCIGPDACANTGVSGGSSSIGNGSCIGGFACDFAGRAGSSGIGDDSCNGFWACYSAGRAGSSSIGDGSCKGSSACYCAGNDGSSIIGSGSCNGEKACYYAGYNGGSSSIGDGSCNGEQACFLAGEGGSSSIGQYSCNYAPATFAGSCRYSTASAPDCQYNDSPPDACLRSVTVTKQFDDGDGELGDEDVFVNGWGISVVCTSTTNGAYPNSRGVTGTDGPGTLLVTVPVNYVCVVTEATDILAVPVLPISDTFTLTPDAEQKTVQFLNDAVELAPPASPPPGGDPPPAATTPDPQPTEAAPPTVSVVEPTATPPGDSTVEDATPIAPDTGTGLAPNSGGSLNISLLVLAVIVLSGAAVGGISLVRKRP